MPFPANQKKVRPYSATAAAGPREAPRYSFGRWDVMGGCARANSFGPKEDSPVLCRCRSRPTGRGAAECRGDRTSRGDEAGSTHSNRKEIRPYFVTATAGQREKSRRLSG